MRILLGLFLVCCVLLPAGAALAQTPQAPFDPEAATEAYLARLTPEQRERSDSYFEGGYWLLLWSFLYGLGVYGLLLFSGFSARMRDLAERMTRFRPLQTLLSPSSSPS